MRTDRLGHGNSMMSDYRDKLADAIRSNGGKYHRRGDVIEFQCPRHKDRKPSAWLGAHRWGCAACGFAEPLHTLGTEFGVEPPRRDYTLEDYAQEKGFNVEKLRKWGVETYRDLDHDVVAIPYRGVHGELLRRKFRSWDRRTWWEERNRPTYLYGLDILAKSPKDVPLILVEGESDCHAGWHHKTLAVGVPGASSWRSGWAKHLAGRTVYIWQEPDQGGETFVRNVTKDLPSALVIRPDGVKDLADLHRADDFEGRLEKLMDGAEPVQRLTEHERRVLGAGDRGHGDHDRHEPLTVPWPAPPAPAARHGLVGEFLDAVEPVTEGDPTAIQVQYIVGFGNAIGRGPCCWVEDTAHYANESVLIVGNTSKSRKGTSEDRALKPVINADPSWCDRHLPGLASGEGLIWAIRDDVEGPIPVKEKGKIVDFERGIIEPGIPDKRLMIRLGEFGSLIRLLERPGNTLSPILRGAWDGKPLASPAKNSPARCREPHVSVIGHVTLDELCTLNRVDSVNGFLNRFLIVCARRSKKLPEGGALPFGSATYLREQTASALEFARTVQEMHRTEAARELWYEAYDHLSEGHAGLLGAATSRSEAHVVRLSMLYALLDRSELIDVEHLEAALAVWEYCERSAGYLFGSVVAHPHTMRLKETLRRQRRLTKTAIANLFHRHSNPEQVAAPLVQAGVASWETQPTGGRPAEVLVWTGQ